MADSIKIDEVSTKFGDYCREVAPTLKQAQFYKGIDSIKQRGIVLETGIRDEMEYAIPFTNPVLKRRIKGGTFNPTEGAMDFIPEKWILS